MKGDPMSLIKVSEGASLALHAMVLIARNRPERMKVKELAERLDGSRAHMAKVFQKLAAAGLVSSTRGPSGGFELNMKPENIAFLDILEIIDGEVKPGGCPFDREECMFDQCIFRDEVHRISTQIHEMYRNIRLSDFVSS
ncbi:MAG: Rrf2 family transcriptional regulator [Candidatus Latescibacteria bacterium]|nr:Rrf2 family transcriptional regulator [bacterium]MBD3424332.1 Rrf2 family transcriptional regulator [Candidatus Latescibacterota bacterium]